MAQLSMFIVVFLALVIPIFMARFKVNNVPTAVAEIIVGIVMGTSGFKLVTNTSQLSFLSDLGVILLLFLSGMEIDFDLLSPKNNPKTKSQSGKEVDPVKTATIAFLGVLLVSLVLAMIIKFFGLFNDVSLATIIFTTVALGVVIATLKEKDILNRPIGQTILLTAVLGEVFPLLGLTIYASLHGGNSERLLLIILLFVAAIILLWRFHQPYNWFVKVTKATTQLDIRLAFFLIFALVTVAETVGAENILGAFLAGMVMKLLEPTQATKDKLTSIGYGFFIPFFFIMTGVKLNLLSIIAHPASLVLLPILVIFFFLAKMPVVLTYFRKFGKRNAFAGGVLTATTITIVLPTLQVARRLNAITQSQSDVFILAAAIVCVFCPIIFNASFKLTPADRIKQRVIMIGANSFTMPIIHDLHDKWYQVKLFTCDKASYQTYKSRVDISLLKQLDEINLSSAGGFNGDIFVAALSDEKQNYRLAELAKANGVKRVIVCVKQPEVARVQKLHDQGIEIFDYLNVRSTLMRALIESPAVYQVMTDTNNVLYSVVVSNTAYTGKPLMSWNFIDKMTVSNIRRKGKWLLPHGKTVIEPGDEIIFSGEFKVADKIRQILSHK